MPTIQLRPDSTYRTGSLTVEGGSQAHEVLSDESDSTYVEGLTPSLSDYLGVRLEPHGLPSDTRIVAIRTVARLASSSLGAEFRAQVSYRIGSNTPGGWANGFGSVYSDGFVNRSTSWRDQAVGFWRPWELDDLTALRVQFGHGVNGGSTADLAVEVDYNAPPEAEITGPDTVVDNTTRPTVAWDFSDPEGGVQEAYELIVLAGSFDAVYDSGVVYSTATQHTLPDLNNETEYTVLLRVSKPWAGEGTLWSSWETLTFTLDLTLPDAPILDLALFPEEARVAVALAPGNDSGAPHPEWYQVEYRDLPDGPWLPLRFAQDIPPEGPLQPDVWTASWLDLWTHPTGVWDHEAPFNRSRRYRARAYVVVDGHTLASPATTQTGELVVRNRWITDVRDPADAHARVSVRDHQHTIQGREVVHRPAGMAVAVVESEAPTFEHTLEMQTLTRDEHDTLAELLASQRTLLYRDRRESVYFRWVGDRTRSQQHGDWLDRDHFSGQMVEVARPPVT